MWQTSGSFFRATRTRQYCQVKQPGVSSKPEKSFVLQDYQPLQKHCIHKLSQKSYLRCTLEMYFVGEIIISNWKPLAIEAICQDDRSKTVGDILLQVSTVPTLKLTLRYLKSSV